MAAKYDLVPLVSPRLATARGQQVNWEWQCDYEDDGRVPLPDINVSREALKPIVEDDKMAQFWAATMTEEVPTGPLAFVEALWFQSIVGIVIAANAIIIGIETDFPSSSWVAVEQGLLLFFLGELLLRVAHHGMRFMRAIGNLFDVIIVLAGVFDMWFVPMVDFVLGRTESNKSVTMSVIQMLRLLRIIRLIRLVKIVQPLYRLALGIAEAIQGMFWVLIFLSMMLYAWAILLTRLIGRDLNGHRIVYIADDAKEGKEEVCSGGCSLSALDVPADEIRAMFHSVLSSMFMLFESMSCWSLMRFTPLFDRIPLMRLAAVFFYIFAAWVLLAVMTGVVSEKMIAAREKMNLDAQDRDQEKQGMAIQVLAELFEKADSDGSGEISREEFNTMLMWTDVTKQLMQHSAVNAQDLNELFEWLDHDKDGMVSVKEFLDGFRWLNDQIRPKSFLKLQEEVAADLRALEKRLVNFINDCFDKLIDAVSQPLRKIHAVTEQIQRLDVQLCTSNSRDGESTLDGLCGELRRLGPPSRVALQELEDRLSKRLDKLDDLVEKLAELQAKGTIRLKH